MDLVRNLLGDGGLALANVLGAFTDLSERSDLPPAEIQQTRPRRPARRGRRGLPSFKELKGLAATYLRVQHKHWPQLVKSRLLPAVTRDSFRALAKQFRKRFLKRRVDMFVHTLATAPWKYLGIGYLRFSDDNSNPRSLDQQLKKELTKAWEQKVFIPWEYVFADARVTGTTAHRRGYQLAKSALRRDEGVKTLYIDELGRASRDTVETLLLGQLVKRLGKRLVGVSDGFDISGPLGSVLLAVFGALQQWFIEQLRAKVNRGMDDCIDEGSNTGVPAVGYKLVPLLDAQGRPKTGKDDAPKKALAIERTTATWVLLAFVLYGTKEWSRDRIAELFNAHKVNGRETWDSGRIRKLLTRWKYIGIVTYRMTYREIVERGKDKGKIKIHKRPRHEWRARKARHLQIVPRWLWKVVQERLVKCGKAFPKKGAVGDGSRTEFYQGNGLIRPVCGQCKDPLSYGHSGKYPSLTCLNGKVGKKNCTCKGYKSVRIIESAVLDHVRDQILTPDSLESLIGAANKYLVAEAARVVDTSGDVARVEAAIRKSIAQRDRLIRAVEGDGEAQAGVEGDDFAAVRTKIRQHERDIRTFKAKLADLKAKRVPPPAPVKVTREDVVAMAADLRRLLESNAEAVRPVLKELTGPIEIYQVKANGKKKPVWEARFAVNLVPALVELGRAKKYPTAGIWEYLSTRRWTHDSPSEVPLERTCKYRTFAAVARQMLSAGASVNAIAAATNTTWPTAKSMTDFLATGEPPRPKKPAKRIGAKGGSKSQKYKDIAETVARLKDKDEMSFAAMIGWFRKHRKFSVSEGTLRRAWNHAHREDVRLAAERGEKLPMRRRYSQVGAAMKARIRQLSLTMTVSEVAKAVGRSGNTVRRVLRDDKGKTQAERVASVARCVRTGAR